MGLQNSKPGWAEFFQDAQNTPDGRLPNHRESWASTSRKAFWPLHAAKCGVLQTSRYDALVVSSCAVTRNRLTIQRRAVWKICTPSPANIPYILKLKQGFSKLTKFKTNLNKNYTFFLYCHFLAVVGIILGKKWLVQFKWSVDIRISELTICYADLYKEAREEYGRRMFEVGSSGGHK